LQGQLPVLKRRFLKKGNEIVKKKEALTALTRLADKDFQLEEKRKYAFHRKKAARGKPDLLGKGGKTTEGKKKKKLLKREGYNARETPVGGRRVTEKVEALPGLFRVRGGGRG